MTATSEAPRPKRPRPPANGSLENGGKSGKASVGVIGGSGFYSLLNGPKTVSIDTPFGKPSDPISLGKIGSVNVAFLPRHGKDHRFPPHKVPYQANLWAFKNLGVSSVISVGAAGSLQRDVKPGEFVILDQFIDRTKSRADTYVTVSNVKHPSPADPYCPKLRAAAFSTATSLKIPVHERGTTVVIEGPRFSTKSESTWFTKMGWEVISMTQYPEVILARELGMCFVGISLITDYDTGLVALGEATPVSDEEVHRVFKKNAHKAIELVTSLAEKLLTAGDCGCKKLGVIE